MSLKLNDKSVQVFNLNLNLKALGYKINLINLFDDLTLKAVTQFQDKNNLVVDGIVGPKTTAKLLDVLFQIQEKSITLGVDLSHWDDVNDFNLIKKAGYDFVYLKATEGNQVDPKYYQYKNAALKANLLVGSYHFFHPKKDLKSSIDTFLSTTKKLKDDLIPCLDWESHDDLKPEAEISKSSDFLKALEDEFKKPPLLYAGFYYLEEIGFPDFSRHPLWLPNYSINSEPQTPKPFSAISIWQFSESFSVPGISNPCDANVFKGTKKEFLEKFKI